MKVVHVNTFSEGGAAKACFNLHEGLLINGIDSTVLTLYPSVIQRNKHVVFKQNSQPLPLLKRIINKFYLSKTLKQNQDEILAFHQGAELFTFLETIYRVEDHPLLIEADIIHLHWISFFVNYETFFSKLSKYNNFE